MPAYNDTYTFSNTFNKVNLASNYEKENLNFTEEKEVIQISIETDSEDEIEILYGHILEDKVETQMTKNTNKLITSLDTSTESNSNTNGFEMSFGNNYANY